MTKPHDIEFLMATPGNYTCTYLAEHLDGEDATSHDAITDYLRREKLTPRGLWEVVKPLLTDSPEAYLIMDDSVHDKRYSTQIEWVKRQYSGTEHGLVRGIGVVTLLHTDGAKRDFYPVDYRVYHPDGPQGDGKSKNQHCREMLLAAKTDQQIQANTVLMDSWYASVDNLKLIHRLGMVFITPLKENRLVSVSKESGYQHLDTLEWTPETLRHGQWVKLKELPFQVRLFKRVAPNGDIDWVITNRPDADEDPQRAITAEDIQDANASRWQIEELHREAKQRVGTEPCQCRKARSQHNHLACCYLAWVSLKVWAQTMGLTLYQARSSLFREYLRAQLRHPTIPAYGIA
ncbi:MAG: transposase [Armatimonadetes bacterium]|nr:transposase [Armatimonadota bacterium]